MGGDRLRSKRGLQREVHGHPMRRGPRRLGRPLGRLSDLRHPRVALAAAFALGTLVTPRLAGAHQVGVSRGEYTANGDHLDAHIALSRRDLLTTVEGIDADGDSALSQTEIDAKRPALERLFVDKTSVGESGVACPGAMKSARLEEPDGVAIDLTFDCPSPGTLMSIDLGFIGELGPGHRHLAHATGRAASVDDLYYRGKTRLDLPVALPEGRSTSPFVIGARSALASLDALLVAAGLVLAVRRSRESAIAVAAFGGGAAIAFSVATFAALSPSSHILPAVSALSVFYIGLEDLFSREALYRWAVALSLGGIQGFVLSSLLGPETNGPSGLAGVGAILVFVVVGGLAATIFGGLGRSRSFDPWGRTACAALIAIAGAARLVLAISHAFR